MTNQLASSRILVFCFVLFPLATLSLWAGVRKEIEAQYKQQYENKAMFVKIPVRGERQFVYPTDSGLLLDRSNLNQPLWFKVGDQVRITSVSFKDNGIEFDVASIDLTQKSRIVFQFATSLQDHFPQQAVFDAALGDTFTEGLSYREIDSAKEQFIKDQFDNLIDQFARTTDTSTEFVIQAISEKNPKFQEARQKLADLEQQHDELNRQREEERKGRQAAESQFSLLQKELAKAQGAQKDLGRERELLLEQRSKLQKEVTVLQDQNRRYQSQAQALETQFNQLAASLDLKSSGNVELGKQVESLGKSIDTLKSDRETLSSKLASVSRQLEALQKNNEKLTSDLSEAQQRNSKLQKELRDLTSNRNSLESRYLENKRRREVLETADELRAMLRLQRRLEDGKREQIQNIDLFLGSQKIGELELEIPQYAGHSITLRYRAESPELVRFSDDERRLYKALGEQIKLGMEWNSWSGQVDPVLIQGDPMQAASPRESVEWVWTVPATLEQQETLSLTGVLVDSDDQSVQFLSQDFTIRPAGLVSRLMESFWIPALLGGFVLGSGLGIAISGSRKKDKRRQESPKRGPEFVVQKKL